MQLLQIQWTHCLTLNWIYDDSNWSLLLLDSIGFKTFTQDIYLRVLLSTRPYQALNWI